MKKLPVTITADRRRLGLFYFFVQLTVLPALLTRAGQFLPAGAANILFYLLNFLCVLGIFHRYLLSSAKVFFAMPWHCLRIAAVCLAAYYGAEFLFTLAVRQLYPGFYNMNDSSLGLSAANPGMYFCLVFLVPIAEEALYRGLLFDLLYPRSRALALAVSTAVFCLIHVMGYMGSYPPVQLALCLLQYVPAGLCLGYAYVRSGSILTPILMHMTVNQIGMLSVR